MEKIYQIALALSEGVGPATGRKLYEHFGSAKAAYTASKAELMEIEGISVRTVKAIGKKAPMLRAEKEMEFILNQGIQVLFWGDPSYPRRLKHCHDAPLILFYKGNADLTANKLVSIVGTRNATNYGRSVCKDLIAGLKAYNPLIISGMAYGIDSYAHQGALDNGLATIGVLGHGLDQIYPQSHTRLANKMLENGGLLTEFISQTQPERHNFPQRNRIIAGIADVLIVVEAPQKGGALITASIANTYNRDVCAVPGNIYQEYSTGCNNLIKNHKAFPVTSAADIAYVMCWDQTAPTRLPKRTIPTSEEENYLYDILLENGARSIESIAEMSGMPISKLSLILLQMELKDLLIKLPGNIYATKGN